MRSVTIRTIQFHYLYNGFSFIKRTLLKQFLLSQLSKEGKQIQNINYIFCSDNYLLELNKQHLNHNTYTDIITFELSEKGEKLIADIYISIERVKENAAHFKVSFQEELNRVIFHGALHLCGYKDKTIEESTLMRQKEQQWLEAFSVSREIETNKD